MSLYKRAKIRLGVDSEEIEVKVGTHLGSVLSPFLQLWKMLSQNWLERVC